LPGLVRYLLSDLGGVVVRLNLARPAARMAARCRPFGRLTPEAIRQAFWVDPALAQYEQGRLTRAAFLEHVRRRTGFVGTDEEFVTIWRGMFRPDRAIVRAWRELVQGGVELWYWSNTSEMHVPWVFEAFPEIAIHTGTVLSYRIGVAKPDPRFYRLGLELMGASPQQCIFVDDDPQNCAAARDCGLTAVQHVDSRRTIATVRRLFGLL